MTSKKINFIKFPKSPNFYKAVTRKESVLIMAFMSNFMPDKKDYLKALGINFRITKFIYLDGVVYNDLNDLEELKNKLFKLRNHDQAFMRLALKCEKISQKILNYTEKIRKSDLEKLKDKELMKEFVKYFRMMKEYTPFLFLPLAVERYYNDRIYNILVKKFGKEKGEEYLSVLIFPEKYNRDYFEHIDFMSLVEMYQKKKKIDIKMEKRINMHLEKYSRMGQRFGFGKIWDRKNIIERLKDYSNDPKKERQDLINRRKENKKLSKKILDEIGAKKEFKKMVKIIKEYVYLRTLRTDTINFSFANMNSLFSEIGKRKGLNFDEINYSTYWEIVEDNVPTKRILKERKKAYGFIHNAKDILIITGDEVEKANNFYGFGEKEKKVSKIYGQVANIGKTQGRVKIIIDNSELNKVKTGDILVAPMTTPDYIAAMEKAVAFVTDEGGITCHAAIVAREMKKPCIIGTKIATQILHDGDLVEVDADQGVVKILKQLKIKK